MKRKVLFAAVVATYAVMAIAAERTTAPRLGVYVDKAHGFKIQIAPDWSQTPTQPGEQTVVAKFKDDRKGSFATLDICRFPVGGEATTGEDAGGDEGRRVRRWIRGQSGPRNAKQYLESVVKRRYRLKEFQLPEPRKVKIDKLAGQYYEFEYEHPQMRGYREFYRAGIISNQVEEYLILYLARSKGQLKFAYSSIRSFRFKDGDDVKSKKSDKPRGKVLAKEGQLVDPEKRERIKKGLVGSWRYFDTPHYIIVYNCDYNLARVIADRIEWIRQYAYEVVFPPLEPIAEAMVVRVCKEMDEYYHYGGPRGSAGYWAASRDEFVLPDLAAKKKVDKKTLGVLHHEGFHQYIYYALLKHNPPVWFNEGFAEFFYCARPRGRTKVAFEPKHDMRYSTFRSALGMDKLIPANEFVKLSHRQYMQQAQLCYTQGWAFATWLKRVTRVERYRQIPDVYFRELQTGYRELAGDGGNPFMGMGMGRGMNAVEKRAFEKAFEGFEKDDWNKLHAAFLADAKRRM